MSREMSPELLAELKTHKGSTKELVTALFNGNLLSEEELLYKLRDTAYDKKPAQIYEAYYRRLHQLGHHIIEIFKLFREHNVPRLVGGLVSVNDPFVFHGLKVFLTDDTTLNLQVLRSDEQMRRPIILPKGTPGRINMLMIPYKAGSISTLEDYPRVDLWFLGTGFPCEMKWTDIDVDVDNPNPYNT